MEVRCVNKRHAKAQSDKEAANQQAHAHGEHHAGEIASKSMVDKIRRDVKGFKSVLKKSRALRRSNESLEMQPLHSAPPKNEKSSLKRISRVYSDEKDKHEDPPEHREKTPSPIGAGLPLLQRLRLLKEKQVELILEQMRLCLLKEDYVSTQIIAKKISIKFFDDPRQQDLKFKFFDLMIRLDRDTSFLKTSRHYQAIADSKPIPVQPMEEDTTLPTSVSSEKKGEEEEPEIDLTAISKPQLTEEQIQDQRQKLKCAVLYCILAPYDNEQNDMMAHLAKNKKLEEIPVYKEILRLFMCKELINFDAFDSEFGCILTENAMFQDSSLHGKKCSAELKDRLIEHNIRIISNYYSRIYLKRMSELLVLPSDKCEEYLSKLANADTIRVKIDRPAEIVYFTTKKTSSDILNHWAQDTNRLMALVNKTCHLINKEECINSVLGIAVED